MIHDYTREAGVRQLEREIAALTRKATRKIVASNGRRPPLMLEADELQAYLGRAPFIARDARRQSRNIGIATGLAWTPVGGDILFIEATRMRGHGQLAADRLAGRGDEGERADGRELSAQPVQKAGGGFG